MTASTTGAASDSAKMHKHHIMKKILYTIILAAAAISCKPDIYLGPLDSPVGNWEGVKGDYYFNGELVAELDSCVFSVISFYRQGYCCIEGIKGAFPFIYDNESGDLQIDSTLWSVQTLTGAEMVMEFTDRIYPEHTKTDEEQPADSEEKTDMPESPEKGTEISEEKPDGNGVILPAEFKGFTIESDRNGYFYTDNAGNTVYCNFKGIKNAEDSLIIDFWYDSHINHFIPLR